jgi:NADH:ubiquinone oxidoreductase subunit 2 (subunit N)
MSLLAFFVVCLGGLLLTLLASGYALLSRVAALASLAAALGVAVFMNPYDYSTLGDVQLQVTLYVVLFLASLAAASLLLCTMGLITGWPEKLAPAALATMAAMSIAISSTDPTVSLAAAAAATTPAALVASRMRSTPLGATVGAAELRTLALVVVAALLAAVTLLNTNWVGDSSSIIALTFLVLAAGVAVRSGVFPFHVPAALLSRSGEGVGLVLSLVWIPTGFGLVALSWNASISGATGDWLDRAVLIVQAVAVATLVLGAVGAMLHDEVEEVVVYSIVQDAGFILLAFTARSADAIGPARLWLLAFVVAKSALVAWAATMSWAFESSNLGELRGWLRRSPLLAVGLVAIVIATLGWPGSPVFEARATMVRLGLPDQLQFVGTAAILLSLAYYARLLAVGLLTPTATVRLAAGERPRWPHLPGVGAVPELDQEPAAPSEPAATPAAPAAPARAVRAINQVELSPADESAETGADEGGGPKIRRPRRNYSIRHRLGIAWRLNRPLQASLLLVATAALAAAVALGGFGSSDASQSGIALDQAVGLGPNPTDNGAGQSPEPTDQPDITPEPAQTPEPTASESTESAAPTPPAATPSATPSPAAS